MVEDNGAYENGRYQRICQKYLHANILAMQDGQMDRKRQIDNDWLQRYIYVTHKDHKVHRA